MFRLRYFTNTNEYKMMGQDPSLGWLVMWCVQLYKYIQKHPLGQLIYYNRLLLAREKEQWQHVLQYANIGWWSLTLEASFDLDCLHILCFDRSVIMKLIHKEAMKHWRLALSSSSTCLAMIVFTMTCYESRSWELFVSPGLHWFRKKEFSFQNMDKRSRLRISYLDHASLTHVVTSIGAVPFVLLATNYSFRRCNQLKTLVIEFVIAVTSALV